MFQYLIISYELQDITFLLLKIIDRLIHTFNILYSGSFGSNNLYQISTKNGNNEKKNNICFKLRFGLVNKNNTYLRIHVVCWAGGV